MSYKGFFKCYHPEKYKGNPTTIFYRSMWECNFMRRLDADPNVEWWQNEEMYVNYFDPTRNKWGHYYPDFRVRYKDGRTVIIEIKPFHETIPPVDKGNKKRFVKQAMLYAKNLAKWNAIRSFVLNKENHEFIILTEKELFNKR